LEKDEIVLFEDGKQVTEIDFGKYFIIG